MEDHEPEASAAESNDGWAPAELVRYRDLLQPLLANDTGGADAIADEDLPAYEAALATLAAYHGNHLDLEEAVAVFARAMWAAPAWAEPPARIAEALAARVKRWPEPARREALTLARTMADRALQIRPVDLTARLASARVRLLGGEIDEAERVAQSLPPEHPPSLAVRSAIAEARGDLPRAVALRQAQIASEQSPPVLREARNKLGLLLQGLGELDEACRVHKDNLARHPDFAWGRVNLGSVLEAKGDHMAAFAEVEKAVQFGLAEGRPFLDELGASLDRDALDRFRLLLLTGRDGDTVAWCPPPPADAENEFVN